MRILVADDHGPVQTCPLGERVLGESGRLPGAPDVAAHRAGEGAHRSVRTKRSKLFFLGLAVCGINANGKEIPRHRSGIR